MVKSEDKQGVGRIQSAAVTVTYNTVSFILCQQMIPRVDLLSKQVWLIQRNKPEFFFGKQQCLLNLHCYSWEIKTACFQWATTEGQSGYTVYLMITLKFLSRMENRITILSADNFPLQVHFNKNLNCQAAPKQPRKRLFFSPDSFLIICRLTTSGSLVFPLAFSINHALSWRQIKVKFTSFWATNSIL